jgi:tetratricopeptide (TPR) repeat protein
LELLKEGRYAKVLEACEQAIKIDPDYALTRYGKGITLHHLGRYEEALQAYEQAIKIDPDDVDTWMALELLFYGEEGNAAIVAA